MCYCFNLLWRIRGTFLIKFGIAVSIVFILWLQLNGLKKSTINDEVSEFVFYESITNITYNFSKNISDIKMYVAKYNLAQKIYNEEIFGPLEEDSLIIAVQVHDRIHYLRELINSLKEARNISKSLLIFSHDYYDDDINDLVQSIDFCKVMQLFYPYSKQLYPNQYPGDDPNDCPKLATKEEALQRKCNNANYPDLYGHYREARFTQVKHHWWWKANRIFDQLEVTKNYTGLILFVEEDHYIAEDFIHVLKLMEDTRKTSCKSCSILSLGTYTKSYKYERDSAKAIKTRWVGNKHNMGMAFDYLTWEEIKNCANVFCTYDDYNWDWSLHYVFRNCFKENVDVMVLKEPRIFHIGACGLHQKKINCDSIISNAQAILKNAHTYLYPNNLELISDGASTKAVKGNGGWGDIRDHMLCFNMTSISHNDNLIALS